MPSPTGPGAARSPTAGGDDRKPLALRPPAQQRSSSAGKAAQENRDPGVEQAIASIAAIELNSADGGFPASRTPANPPRTGRGLRMDGHRLFRRVRLPRSATRSRRWAALLTVAPTLAATLVVPSAPRVPAALCDPSRT